MVLGLLKLLNVAYYVTQYKFIYNYCNKRYMYMVYDPKIEFGWIWTSM